MRELAARSIAIFSVVGVLLLIGACSRQGLQGSSTIKSDMDVPRLLWRDDSGIPLDKVPTPEGFKLRPTEAVGNILARMSRAPWYVAYLFADETFYYVGLGDTRDFPEIPTKTATRINGHTGELIPGE